MAAPQLWTWIGRPLPFRHVVTASLALVAGGTLYCTLYCLIAFPPMHHRMMPVSYSAVWATFAILPWFVAFEVAKRCVAGRAMASVAKRGAGLVIATSICSVGLETIANAWFGVQSRTLTFQLADQLPAFLITAAAFGLAARRGASTPAGAKGEHDGPMLPPADQIEWIAAAGNYVEIRAGSRLLIRRLTMREAEALLDPARFVRIHRSALVNRDHVEDWRGRTVRMRDGTVLRVGDSHRRKLAALTG